MQTDDPLARAQRRLRLIRWVGLLDLALLVSLVASSLTGSRGLVSVLGPIHGGTFLLLLTLAITGAADGLWRWWFPLGILLTGGPVGALVGEWAIERAIKLRRAEVAGGQPPVELERRV